MTIFSRSYKKPLLPLGFLCPQKEQAFTIYSVKTCIIRWQTGMKAIGSVGILTLLRMTLVFLAQTMLPVLGSCFKWTALRIFCGEIWEWETSSLPQKICSSWIFPESYTPGIVVKY